MTGSCSYIPNVMSKGVFNNQYYLLLQKYRILYFWRTANMIHTWQEKQWRWKVNWSDLMTRVVPGIGWRQRAHWPPPNILNRETKDKRHGTVPLRGQVKVKVVELTCSSPADSRYSRPCSRVSGVSADHTGTGCISGSRCATRGRWLIGRSARIPALRSQCTWLAPGWTQRPGPGKVRSQRLGSALH